MIMPIRELRLVEETGSSKSEGGLRLLFSRPFRKVLVLGIIVAVFQQWCGTNVIFNYAQEIFQSAGYSLGDVLFNIVGDRCGECSFYFCGYLYSRTLGTSRSDAFRCRRAGWHLSHSRHLLFLRGKRILYGGTCCAGYRLLCNVPKNFITWVLLAEIFPNRVRAVAMATCTFALWV